MAGDWEEQAARRAGAPLKTEAVRRREAEEAARAHPPIPVRVLLQGGLALQASFAATETIAALQVPPHPPFQPLLTLDSEEITHVTLFLFARACPLPR